MTTQEAQKSAYQNRAAKSREKYQQELAAYNANKKAAAKADSAAPAAEAAPKKRKKSKSEDGGEKKKVAFRRDDWSLQIYVYNSQGGLFMRYTARFHGVPFRTAKKEQEEGQGHGVRSCVLDASDFCCISGFARVFRLDTLGSASGGPPE